MKKDYPYVIAFNQIKGLGPVKMFAIFQHFETFENAWNSDISEFSEIKNLSEANLKDISESRKKLIPEKELAKILINDVEIVTLIDDNYPPLLKEVHDPPFVLFYRGEFTPEIFDKTVGVVGTRKPSYSGKKVTSKLCYELAEYGVTIVSGLALGIDAEAHKGALKYNEGKTIAVLGCGPDIIYPSANQKIYDEIVERGLIISEYPTSSPPEGWRFPARNRLISGLSKGTLIIEAGEKSGALITTDFALEQGREVMAVPSDILNPMGKGPNNLIKQGASVITSSEDILECLNWKVNFDNKKIEIENNKICVEKLSLNDLEREIYYALDYTPIHLDSLINKLNLPLADITSNLIMLELKNLVKQLPGKLFFKV